MSETGDPAPGGTAVRVEDIERALVLAREVASATAKGGPANLRMEHLQALFGNGHGRVAPERIQAALEAAGLSAEPPLTEAPDTVQLRVERRRAALSRTGASAPKPAASPGAEPAAGDPSARLGGLAAYQAMAGRGKRTQPKPEPAAAASVSLDEAGRIVAAEHAEQNTAQSIAALMPAMIIPVLAASFLGPLFGAVFAGLALLSSALLSRPGALADGKLGPIRMPASLARSFLLLSAGIALGALATSLALVAAGGSDTKSDPNAPIEQKKTAPATPTAPRTTPPAPPAKTQQQQQQDAAAKRRAERRRAQRRREARAKARARERARQREATPPSGAAPDTGTTTTP